MITTTGHFNRKGRLAAGFTLTELMIVMTLTVIMSGALFSAFGFVLRSSLSISNYVDMTSAGRRGLEYFARDVRMADDISNFSENAMTLQIDPRNSTPYEVTYRYVEADEAFEREEAGNIRVLMNDVKEFHLRRFNVVGTETVSDLETKQIQLELSMIKEVLGRDTSEKVVSARFIMRNKKVAE